MAQHWLTVNAATKVGQVFVPWVSTQGNIHPGKYDRLLQQILLLEVLRCNVRSKYGSILLEPLDITVSPARVLIQPHREGSTCHSLYDEAFSTYLL